MNKKSMVKALNKKFKEMLSHIEKRYPEIEIRNFDYSLTYRVVSLVEDIIFKLNRICLAEKYKFYYYVLFPINREKFIVSSLNLSITGKKFTHTSSITYQTTFLKMKPSEKGKGALFVTLYHDNLECNPLELDNILKRIAIREKLYLHKGFAEGVGYGNPFPKGYFAFEIPFDVEILEYII